MLPLKLADADYAARAVSPFLEMGAYEALWCQSGVTFKRMAGRFSECPDCMPSMFVPRDEAREHAEFVTHTFAEAGIGRFGVQIRGTCEYPDKLMDAAYPVELLYYQGSWDLAHSPSVAVVGTRKPSPEGLSRTRRLVRCLVQDGITVVSGLAAGIDRQAHETALEENGQTFAVIGTPLSSVYPKEHDNLQRRLAEQFLVVSQVPVKRYGQQDYRANRTFFPERNITMSALTDATVIVEASDTSGTLHQARAALRQNRKLFILDNCFRNGDLTWPAVMESKGAIRVKDYDDIQEHLGFPSSHGRRLEQG